MFSKSSSNNEQRKRCVLRADLIPVRVVDVHRAIGKSFHARGPAYAKARFPSSVLVAGEVADVSQITYV